MKAKLFAIGLFLFALAACIHLDDRSVETRLATPNTSYFIASPENKALQELYAIDSLMWQRPDSALCCLLPYFDICCRDAARHVSTKNDWHYANLLLAELLYKNDNPQLNRTDLLQAVDYYDSIYECKDVALNVSTHAFLTARAHYINGVGYYEHDSTVEACQEYLKVLEVMENHFEDKDLIGNKAKFLALTYGRLGEMFNEQLLAEPAITCYKQALLYCKRETTSIYGIPVLLYWEYNLT